MLSYIKFICFEINDVRNLQLSQFGVTLSWCQLRVAWKSSASTIKLSQLKIVQKLFKKWMNIIRFLELNVFIEKCFSFVEGNIL